MNYKGNTGKEDSLTKGRFRQKNWIHMNSIRKKLIFAFGSIILLLIVTASVSVYNLLSVTRSYSQLTDKSTKSINIIKEIQINITKQVSSIRKYYASGNTSGIQEYERLNNELDTQISQLEQLPKSDQIKFDVSNLIEMVKNFKALTGKSIEDSKKDYEDTKLAYEAMVAPVGEATIIVSEELSQNVHEAIDENIKQMNDKVNFIITFILITIILIILGAIFIAVILSKHISTSTQKLHSLINNVANGDLTNSVININSKDELGKLAYSTKVMIENIKILIAEIQNTALQLFTSAQQVSISANESSKASEHIATTVQEIVRNTHSQVHHVEVGAVSINKTEKEIMSVVTKFLSVKELATNASNKSDEGKKCIQSAVNQMDTINLKIEEISREMDELGMQTSEVKKIANTIFDVASQTNLLALNASIEASRVGEFGAGFAVVAMEIKKLANQTSDFSKQISVIIESIGNKTEQVTDAINQGKDEIYIGTKSVKQAGKSFNEIFESINKVTKQTQDMINSVNHMKEESQALGGIMRVIDSDAKQIFEVTENASASTEEQLAAIEQFLASSAKLYKMAKSLQHSVIKFKI